MNTSKLSEHNQFNLLRIHLIDMNIQIEGEIVRLFGAVSKIEDQIASTVMYNIINNRARLQIIKDIIDCKYSYYSKSWKQIEKRISCAGEKRNKMAHWSLMRTFEEGKTKSTLAIRSNKNLLQKLSNQADYSMHDLEDIRPLFVDTLIVLREFTTLIETGETPARDLFLHMGNKETLKEFVDKIQEAGFVT